jgi:hypothetical protein
MTKKILGERTIWKSQLYGERKGILISNNFRYSRKLGGPGMSHPHKAEKKKGHGCLCSMAPRRTL